MMYVIGLVLVLATSTWSIEMDIEAETRRGSAPIRSRSEASGFTSVYLHKGETILLLFCLTDPAAVSIKSVVYSNNGGADDVEVVVDDTTIGSFTTEEQLDWNEFSKSGAIGNEMMLKRGVHTIELKVVDADFYGVELDRVSLEVGDAFLYKDSKSFTCQLPCLTEMERLRSQARPGVSNGDMKQNSYATRCAEEDNVDISLFHDSVKEYTVTASMPKYHSFTNARNMDTSNCPFLPPNYWIFQDVSVDDLLAEPSIEKGVVLSHFGEGASTAFQFTAIFNLTGKSLGHIDSEIGSKLKLSLNGLTENADVSILYKGRAASYSEEPAVQFTTGSSSFEWDIPDFTWIETSYNEIVLKIVTNQNNDIVIGSLSLERRFMTPDTVHTITKTEKVSIEGVAVDFWWRSPETMSVTLSTTGENWDQIDYIRIAIPVPWGTNTWGQVFVMYQDGNIRLLPLVPPGVGWIPFGTSVIVGQTNHTDVRPVAPISHVVIDPVTLTLDVTYYDGGSAQIHLASYFDTTTIRVSNLKFEKNCSEHPFATFRSMFAASGNDDSDSVVTNIEGPTHVMKEWGSMAGTSFQVFRRCLSEHLTQSPDVRVDIIDG